MEDHEKINIFVPEQTKALLEHDARLFEFFKKDGQTINRNQFLTKLIVGYHATYESELQTKYDAIFSELADYIDDETKRAEAADKILKSAVMPDTPRQKGKKSPHISLKPTKDTAPIISRVAGNNSFNDSISKYFCRMFISYIEKPLYERERIVFHKNVELLLNGCASKHSVSFFLASNPTTIHEVVPYELAVGQDEMFNYLLCQEQGKNGEFQAMTYRLNRITGLAPCTSPAVLSKTVKRHLEQMKKYGAQYPINDDEETCVRLTDEGIAQYRRIYYGRPQYERIESAQNSSLYYFACSKEQIFFYFRRFDRGSAEIILPSSQRERMISFHQQALKCY